MKEKVGVEEITEMRIQMKWIEKAGKLYWDIKMFGVLVLGLSFFFDWFGIRTLLLSSNDDWIIPWAFGLIFFWGLTSGFNLPVKILTWIFMKLGFHKHPWVQKLIKSKVITDEKDQMPSV